MRPSQRQGGRRGNMTLTCERRRLRLAQLLSILHLDQQFWSSSESPELKRRRWENCPLLCAWLKAQPRRVVVSFRRMLAPKIRRRRYQLYLKHDFKGCAANKSDDAVWHLLYIICYLWLLWDIKLQQQYEDLFPVWPWLNFSFAPLMHMLSPRVIGTRAVCLPLC